MKQWNLDDSKLLAVSPISIISIVDLMKIAHTAGRNGIDFKEVLETTRVDPDNPKAYAARYVLILLDNDHVDWNDDEQRENLFFVYKLLRQRFEKG